MTRIPVSFKGRTVGFIDGISYCTERTRDKHLFLKYQGYGISLDILDKLRWAGVEEVRILEDKSALYVSRLDDWFGAERFNYQGDEQRILPLSAMRRGDEGAGPLSGPVLRGSGDEIDEGPRPKGDGGLLDSFFRPADRVAPSEGLGGAG